MTSGAVQKSNGRFVLLTPSKIFGALIAVLSVTAYFMQADTSAKQATTAGQQYSADAEALFRSKKLEPDENIAAVQDRLKHGFSTFDYRVQNVGKIAATNVVIRCGRKDEHGPRGDLGTIAVGDSYDIHSQISGRSDVLHESDNACFSEIFLSYDDPIGHHFIEFDGAGNPKKPSDDE